MRTATCAAVLILTAGLTLLASGCGGHRHALPVIRISERDFAIAAPRTVEAGRVQLVVHNEGPVEHELLVARVEPGRLPVRDDGFTISEESIESRLVAVIEPQAPGHDATIDVDLARGRYVLFCNMAGHYAAGMLRTLRVR
jgi:uncharacterized cupredoxin-like copper-binding protein